jgi:hypothetical protein
MFENLLCSELFDNFAKYLDIHAINALSLTNKKLYNFINTSTIQKRLIILHFGHNYKKIYKIAHFMKYYCGNERELGGELFTCNNSPVYCRTVCYLCGCYAKFCDQCSYDLFGERTKCNDCNKFIAICLECTENVRLSLIGAFNICEKCNESKCDKHFSFNNHICKKCTNEPDLNNSSSYTSDGDISDMDI